MKSDRQSVRRASQSLWVATLLLWLLLLMLNLLWLVVLSCHHNRRLLKLLPYLASPLWFSWTNMHFEAEASCHWGTWGTSPPDGVATLVNSLQKLNRVKSITLCVILNAKKWEIVVVTLCIQIEWLFYIAFWCETVTRKWRCLHPGHGGTCPHFYKWLGAGALRVIRTKNKIVIKLYWPHGSAYQNDWLYL